MSEPFIGEIKMFGGNFAPRGWAFCDGQLLSIASNTALFAILGTTYGGDGRTTFGLPDLRGRFAMHPGTGPGLSQRRLGERGGEETHAHPAIDYQGQNKVPFDSRNAAADRASNLPPYTCVNFIIAVQGIFPSRS